MKQDRHFEIYTVICGSFRKHLAKIAALKVFLEEHKIGVLSPGGVVAQNPDEEFIILDSDPTEHPKVLQDSVFAKIRRSTFIVIANVDGYLGKAALMEIGYAIGQGIDVYTLEPMTDPNLVPYCRHLKELFPHLTLEKATV
jgi:nucleoside 2-deoxyribosyltransferase